MVPPRPAMPAAEDGSERREHRVSLVLVLVDDTIGAVFDPAAVLADVAAVAADEPVAGHARLRDLSFEGAAQAGDF